jgi:hypothetical protein
MAKTLGIRVMIMKAGVQRVHSPKSSKSAEAVEANDDDARKHAGEMHQPLSHE